MINFMLTSSILIFLMVIGVGFYLILGCARPEWLLAETLANQGQFAEASYHLIKSFFYIGILLLIINILPSSSK